MSNEIKQEELTDLKHQLWTKISIINAKLGNIDQGTDDYRKTLDIYHKLVKSYLDIIKVQRYAPGAEQDDNGLTALFEKAKERLLLNPQDKKALMEFKNLLDVVEKKSLMAYKEG